MNARLLKARREGRLEEELCAIEREGMDYYRQIMSKGVVSSRRPRRSGKARHALA